MITVIDLEIGNTASVSGALRRLGIPYLLSRDPADIEKADKLILPGVGSFSEAMKRIALARIGEVIKKKVLNEKTPILGICLGMQVFARYGEEGGPTEGLGLINSRVVHHRAKDMGLKLPHIGWNEVHHDDMRIFDSIEDGACFYFVHSYEMILSEDAKTAYSDYGVKFVAAVQKDNIIGVQFHPEKSQRPGLKLLDNFCKGIS